MDIEEKINYWLDIAAYDLDTAKAMLSTQRFLYVGYMCHQVIEKALKAYYWFYKKEEPPYTHNLINLCEKLSLDKKISQDQNKLILKLMPLNIEARYPSDKVELNKSLDFEKSNQILNDTEIFYQWIKQLLKK